MHAPASPDSSFSHQHSPDVNKRPPGSCSSCRTAWSTLMGDVRVCYWDRSVPWWGAQACHRRPPGPTSPPPGQSPRPAMLHRGARPRPTRPWLGACSRGPTCPRSFCPLPWLHSSRSPPGRYLRSTRRRCWLSRSCGRCGRLPACVCVRACVRAFVCVHVCTCVWVCACVCARTRVHACVGGALVYACFRTYDGRAVSDR